MADQDDVLRRIGFFGGDAVGAFSESRVIGSTTSVSACVPHRRWRRSAGVPEREHVQRLRFLPWLRCPRFPDCHAHPAAAAPAAGAAGWGCCFMIG